MTFQHHPSIFAFYSFKGGVGRSMALLNCAWCLASFDRRVLMVDLDLDSPGLSFMPRELSQPGSQQIVLGMVDVLERFVDSSDLFMDCLPDLLKSAIVPFPLPQDETNSALANVSLLPAGDLTDEYVARISSLRWQDAPLATKTEQFAQLFRKAVLGLNGYDYVLIDCRTGWSESGYIACRLLADHVIAFTALNEQNARGTAHFLAKVASWGENESGVERQVALVASPVPEWEEESKRQRIREVIEILRHQFESAPEFTVQLPYHPSVALREQFVVSQWRDSSLSRSYFSLVQCMLEMNNDSADYLDKAITDDIDTAMRKAEFDPRLRPELVIEKLQRLRGVSAARFRKMSKYSRMAFIRQGKALFDAYDIASIDYFNKAILVAEEAEDLEPRLDALTLKAEACKRFGRYSDALLCFRDNAFASLPPDMQEIYEYSMADIDRLCFRLDKAERSFSALFEQRALKDPSSFYAAAAIALGDILRLKRRHVDSASYFKLGAGIAKECKDDRLAYIAKMYSIFIDARTNTSALEAFRKLIPEAAVFPDVSLSVKAQLLLAELEDLAQRPDNSIESASTALDTAEKYSMSSYAAEAHAILANLREKKRSDSTAKEQAEIAKQNADDARKHADGARKHAEAAKKHAEAARSYFDAEGIVHPMSGVLQKILQTNTESA